MTQAKTCLKLRSLQEALDSLNQRREGTRDITGACLMAGGVSLDDLPEDYGTRRQMLHENADARLATHALANADAKAAARWQDCREYPDGLQSMPGAWCEIVAGLMSQHQFDGWISAADRHLDIARTAKYEILPALAGEFRQEKLLAMAVAQCGERYHVRYGRHPGGRFGLTILEAYLQFNGGPL